MKTRYWPQPGVRKARPCDPRVIIEPHIRQSSYATDEFHCGPDNHPHGLVWAELWSVEMGFSTREDAEAVIEMIQKWIETEKPPKGLDCD